MHHSLRSVAALSCLGWVIMFGLHGCSNRLGPVQATQNGGSIDHPNLPDIFVEQAKQCVEFDGRQLEKGRVVLDATVDVNKDGDNVGATVNGIPETARDFGICIRKVLEGMPLAKQPFHDAVKILEFNRKHAKDSQVALERFLEVIPGVPIVESELVLEADGYTVVLPVTVKVVAKLEEFADGDQSTMEKIGQIALDSIGYDEIMNRAKQVGWVKTVRKTQPKASAGKGLISQSETEVVVVIFEVFTTHAVTAGVVSQLDSPLPGPADLAAIGILAIGLYKVGALGINALTTATAPAPTSPPPPPPPPRETCENDMPHYIRCNDPGISHYKFFSETEAYKSIKVKGIKMEKSKAKATDGPCEGRGGWHTNVKHGKDYVASIMGCNCCDDSSGKAIQKERARVRFH